MNYEYVCWIVSCATGIIAITSGLMFFLQHKKFIKLKNEMDEFASKMAELDHAIENTNNAQIEFQKNLEIAYKEFTLRTKAQMFLHESNLLNEKGEWVLEYNGERKIFKPAKILSVNSADNSEESSFIYTDTEVICTTTLNGQIKSEFTFSLAGVPKAGKIFVDGKPIKEFCYNELGQVVEK